MKKRTALSTLAILLAAITGMLTVKKSETQMAVTKAIVQDSPLNCNAKTYQIFPDALELWNTTWNAYYQTEEDDGIRTVSSVNMQLLYSQIDTTKQADYGVRMFYGLENEKDSVPALYLINTVNCTQQERNVILKVTASDEGTEDPNQWISLDEANEDILRWQSRDRADGETVVYAYNYSWNQFKDLLGEDFTTPLHVVYGLRTLSPQENETDFQASGDGVYGSIVYVNVLYTSSSTTQAKLTTDGPIMDDFSRPCPKYCDPEDPGLVNVQKSGN